MKFYNLIIKFLKNNFPDTFILTRYEIINLYLKLFLLLISFTFFILLGLNSLSHNTNPEGYDTTGYLLEANLIKENGGILNFFNLCIKGKYKQANQHPLYILVLSTFASRDISFFVNAKITSFLIGIVLIIVLYTIAYKKYGSLTAIVAILGLLLNISFIKWTTLVACESLFMLFSLLCMYFISIGFEDNKKWAYAGMFAGMSFMTKGIGLFLLPGFVIAFIYKYKFSLFRNLWIYIFFLNFLLISSPLLIRNVVLYQNPFYNINISSKLDKLNVSNPDLGSNIRVYQSQIKNKKIFNNNVTQSKFKESNISNSGYLMNSNITSPNFIIKIISKIKRELSTFLRSLTIFPFNKIFSSKKILFFNFLFLFFLSVGFFRNRNIYDKLYLFFTLLVFIILLAIFRPIERYFLPIIPYLWIFIALGILSTIDFLLKHIRIKYLKQIVIIFSSILIIFFLINGGSVISKSVLAFSSFDSVEYNESRQDLLSWLRDNLSKNDFYCEGPNLSWQLYKGTKVQIPYENRYNFDTFNSFLMDYRIKYVIIDYFSLTTSRYRGGGIDRRLKFEGYFKIDPLKGIIQVSNIPNWRLVYKDSREKSNFMIFEIL